jgi:hypothetical protein
MKQCRTTLDGVEFFLAPPTAPKPRPQPQPRPPRERIRAKFNQLRRLVESDQDLSRVWLNPEDLQ